MLCVLNNGGKWTKYNGNNVLNKFFKVQDIFLDLYP